MRLVRLISEDHTRLVIPTARGSDYTFAVFIYDDLADLSVSAQWSSDPDAYFWSYACERRDYRTFDAMVESFRAIVLAVAGNPTRIRENTGPLFRGYTLEYESNGRWVPVQGSAALRFSNFRFPRTPGSSSLLTASSRPWSDGGTT